MMTAISSSVPSSVPSGGGVPSPKGVDQPLGKAFAGYVPVASHDAQFPLQDGVEDTFLRKSTPLFSLPSYRGRGAPVARGIYHHLRSVVMDTTQGLKLDTFGRGESLQRLLHNLRDKPRYNALYNILDEQNTLTQDIWHSSCTEGLVA